MKTRILAISIAFVSILLLGGCAHTRNRISVKAQKEEKKVVETSGSGVAQHRVRSGEPLDMPPGLYIISIAELPAETATLAVGAKKIESLKKGMAYVVRLDAGDRIALTWSGAASVGVINTISSVAAAYFAPVSLACQTFDQPYVTIISECELRFRLSPCKNGKMKIKFTRLDGTSAAPPHTSRTPLFDDLWFPVRIKIPQMQTPVTISIVCEPGENSLGACDYTVGFN